MHQLLLLVLIWVRKTTHSICKARATIKAMDLEEVAKRLIPNKCKLLDMHVSLEPSFPSTMRFNQFPTKWSTDLNKNSLPDLNTTSMLKWCLKLAPMNLNMYNPWGILLSMMVNPDSLEQDLLKLKPELKARRLLTWVKLTLPAFGEKNEPTSAKCRAVTLATSR